MHYHVHRHEVGILFHSFPYFSILYCTTAGRDAIARTSIRSRSWRSRSPMPLPRGTDQRVPAVLMARTTRWSTKWRAASTSATATRTAGHRYSMRRDDGPANKVCADLDHPQHSTCNPATFVNKNQEEPGRAGNVLLRERTSCRYLPLAAGSRALGSLFGGWIRPH